MNTRETLVAQLRDRVADLAPSDHLSLPVALVRLLIDDDPVPTAEDVPDVEPIDAPEPKPPRRRK